MREGGPQPEPIESLEAPKRRPELSFYFSAHHSPGDFAAMKEAFAQTDLYISEAHGWTPSQLEELQAISDGTTVPKHLEEKREPRTAIEFEDGLLYNSHKPVAFFDIPEGHELADADDGQEALRKSTDDFLYGDFEEGEKDLRSSIDTNVDFLDKKDKWIAEKIKADLPTIIEEHPALKDKTDVHALIQMGAMHTNIRRLASDTFSTKRVGEPTFTFGFHDELTRRTRFKKEIPSDLPAQALLEVAIKSQYGELMATLNHQRVTKGLRAALDSADRAHIQAVSNQLFTDMTRDIEHFDPKESLAKALKDILHLDIETLLAEIKDEKREPV